jgi:hypothetical protein
MRIRNKEILNSMNVDRILEVDDHHGPATAVGVPLYEGITTRRHMV